MPQIDQKVISQELVLRRAALCYLSGAILLWLVHLSVSRHEDLLIAHHSISGFIFLATLPWVYFFLLAMVLLFESSLSWRRRLINCGFFLLLTASFLLGYPVVKQNTSLGVIFFNGADIWVARAAEARTDEEALRAIKLVLIAEDKHGGAIACASISKVCSPADQERLLTLLAARPPVEEWRGYFQEFLKNHINSAPSSSNRSAHEP
jgi:hypothetical protein